MKSDRETLKAWCHWKRLEIERLAVHVRGDELDFLKAIEDLISQVGTLEARLAKAVCPKCREKLE